MNLTSCSPRMTAANELLALVLRASYEGGGFTVVSPETGLGHMDAGQAEAKAYLLEHLKVEGCDLRPLVDLLFARNEDPTRLSLPSSPDDGYLIDYDGKFERYFAEGGGGWERWHAENPEAYGWTEVSLPAYDPASKIGVISPR